MVVAHARRVVIAADETAVKAAAARLATVGLDLREMPEFRTYVVDNGAPVIAAPVTRGLTDHEVAILRLLAEGLTNDGIGKRLDSSEPSVKHYMHCLFGKLGARDRANAVLLGCRAGLIGGA